jgi:hypothetical protein
LSFLARATVYSTKKPMWARHWNLRVARFPLAVAGAGADEALASQVGATYLPDGPVEAAALVASAR